ncbi:diguanylate cyclase [Sphingomonas sp. AOB5]|uniref:GGDEF domain-containing protein n=1 Tax=Sphingomonas sp. AOB5 TaxID=3034017 RepID=UPI0023FA2E5C|nr:diguanylate cyclase [Sphingomonas sp. AOB5]MDF7777920.1 diguanylate cyclase [Sphingomonas sp. AOB5]
MMGWTGGSTRPEVPEEVRNALAVFQFDSMRRQIPILHAIALLNILIVDFVLWHDGQPLRFYAWTPIIGVFSLWRLMLWRGRNGRERPPLETIRRQLHGVHAAALASVGMISGFTVITYLGGGFGYPVLIPVSLAFGTFSIAHCLAPLRATSISVLLLGIAPAAVTMMATGSFMERVIGLSMLSVALLKIGFLRDTQKHIVDLLVMEKKVRDLATYDSLTGIHNRRAFEEAVAARIAAQTARSRDRFALALIDLDDFKGINDTRGHHAGDAVLKAVAERLAAHAGAEGIVGRLGGDEFVAMLPAPVDRAALERRMTALIAGLCVPASIDEEPVPVGASLGFAVFPDDADDYDRLVRTADQALYAAKREGKGCAQGPSRAASVEYRAA